MTTKPAYGTMVNGALSISNGLIGAWLFNEGLGTTVHDSSGNGNHATAATGGGYTNPTWDGTSGLIFSGTNQALVLPAAMAQTSFTWLIDLSLTSAAETDRIVSIGETLLSWSSGTLTGFANTQAGVAYQESLAWTAGAIQQLVWQQTGNTATIYANGVSLGTLTNIASVNTTDGNDNIAGYGGSRTSPNQFCKGEYYYAMLWNRVLSPTEIATLNSNPFAMYSIPSKPAFGFSINPALTISSGIVGSWLLNEATGTTVYDSSGQGHNGVFAGTTPPTWSIGQYGPTLHWSANSNQSYVNIATPAISTLPLSYCVTANLSDITTNQYLFDLGGNKYAMHVLSSFFEIFNGSGFDGSITPVANQQYVIIVTINASGSATMTINGAAAGTFSVGVNGLGTHFTIGDYSGGGNYSPNNGKIDSVTLWNRVLSSTEIAALSANPFAPYGISLNVARQLFFKLI